MSLFCTSQLPTISYPWTGKYGNYMDYIAAREAEEEAIRKQERQAERDDEYEFDTGYWKSPYGCTEEEYALMLLKSGKATPGQIRHIRKSKLAKEDIIAESEVRQTLEVVVDHVNQNESTSDGEDSLECDDGAEDFLLEAEDASSGFYLNRGKAYNSLSECPVEGLTQFVPLVVGGGRDKKARRKRYKKKKNVEGQGRGKMIEAGQLGYRNPSQMKVKYPPIKEFWRYQEIFTTDGSGNISLAISLRNPLKAINGSGVYLRADDLAKVYDEFKVLKVGLVMDYLYLNPIVGDCAISTDYDSVPAGPYTFNNLMDNQYTRVFNGTNQISYQTKVPALTEGTYNERVAIIHRGGYYDFNSPPDEGFIAVALERFQPNTRLIRVTVMMEVLCRRRRTLNQPQDSDEEPPPVKKVK